MAALVTAATLIAAVPAKWMAIPPVTAGWGIGISLRSRKVVSVRLLTFLLMIHASFRQLWMILQRLAVTTHHPVTSPLLGNNKMAAPMPPARFILTMVMYMTFLVPRLLVWTPMSSIWTETVCLSRYSYLMLNLLTILLMMSCFTLLLPPLEMLFLFTVHVVLVNVYANFILTVSNRSYCHVDSPISFMVVLLPILGVTKMYIYRYYRRF